jgi:hypothetical protein
MKLSKKGYQIIISSWVGNFGNNLLQLSGALKVAFETQSTLEYPDHKIIPKFKFDFCNIKNKNCHLLVKSPFFYHDECFQYPLIYDQERREISLKFILPLLKTRFERFSENKNNKVIKEDTLVINIRSGDIFSEDYNAEDAIKNGIKNYVQPPLAFYEFIIKKFNFNDVLIITQPDKKNPVIRELLRGYKNIEIYDHIDPLDDFMMLLQANHLVTCHSSFSWFVALMSDNLKILHQPDSFSLKGVTDFDIYSYSFNNYIKQGAWKATHENLIKMIELSIDEIDVKFSESRQILTFDGLEKSSFGNKRGWVPKMENNSSIFIQNISDFYWKKFKEIVRPRTRLKRIFGFVNFN